MFDPFGAALCLFLSGFFFVRLMRRARYLTVIDFFERRYGKAMSLLGSIAQLLTYFAWTGAQIVAGGNIIHALARLAGSHRHDRSGALRHRLHRHGRPVGRHACWTSCRCS